MPNKTKKKKKKNTKKLPIIEPDFILKNQCWLPNKCSKVTTKTQSWFNIKSTNKFSNLERDTIEVDTSCLRVEHIEIYPNKEQKIKLLDWLDTYRRLYNLTVKHRSRFMKKGYMCSYFKMRTIIQKEILPNNKKLEADIHKLYLPKNERIYHSVPKHSIWNAINDVKKAFDSAMANKIAGNIKSFRLRYKKSTNPISTFVIEPGTFSKSVNGFAIKALKEMKSSKLFGEVEHDCRLSYNSITDKFILYKPYNKKTNILVKRTNLISLDPGLRTFQNGYSPDGICYKFAEDNYIQKIKNIFKRIKNAKILKRKNVTNQKNLTRNKNHKKFIKRLRYKITNMVTDLHWKLSLFLCRKFNTILVGNMSTTGIVKKDTSKLSADDKILCIALSHYKFRERLLSKAEEYNVICKIVDESYTTQTCGKCGQRNLNVGGDRIFKCPINSCKFIFDRDYNAGRNIYLKSLSNKIV